METTMAVAPQDEPATVHVGFAVFGPVALGAAIGLGSVSLPMLRGSLALPALVLGLAAALVPALYIGRSLAGAPTNAAELGRSVLRALASLGITMAGIAPAVLFLISTSESASSVLLFAYLSVGTAALIGVRRLYQELSVSGPRSGWLWLVFVAWAMLGLALGANLLPAALDAGRMS